MNKHTAELFCACANKTTCYQRVFVRSGQQNQESFCEIVCSILCSVKTQKEALKGKPVYNSLMLPSQAHRTVHCRAALTHLHRLVVQPWRQPQLTSSSEGRGMPAGLCSIMDKTIQCPVASGHSNVDESSSTSLVPIYGLPDKLLLEYVGAKPLA